MADEKQFEEALMNHLRGGLTPKNDIKKISSVIAQLSKAGLSIDRIRDKGVPADFWKVGTGQLKHVGYIINGVVHPDFFNKFNRLGVNWRQFEVFPYGIINPEGLKFRAEFEV
ncbi:MAG: hypothetical protein ACRCVT_15140 [Leadbetterella sp.]